MMSELKGPRVVRSEWTTKSTGRGTTWYGGGLLDGSQRGRWALSSEGWTLPLGGQDLETAYALFRRVRVEADQRAKSDTDDGDSEQPPEALDEGESVELALTTDLRSTVLALSPGGFENLCKRLLTELGVVQLRTVGQAGDRGIDVEGHLRVNAVVSFMTTSVFTSQAEEQATSPGYKPIDLIDGERLIELLQEYGLGIRQLMVVDGDFFAPFK